MNMTQDSAGQDDSPLVSSEILHRVGQARRAEAEIERLAWQMRNVSVADRADAAEASRLRERRDHLLRTAGRDFALTDVAAQRRDLLVVSISDLLFPWQVINLPFMYEGIDETPGGAGTSGSIATAGLYAGGLGYGGMPEDSGTSQPYTEKWWIHNWYNSVVFPTSPYNGRLYYRFTVDSECHIYDAPVYSGSIREFVTIGWTSDIATNQLADWTTWQTVGWPVNESLPSGSLNLGGGVPVVGSIPVVGGRSAALGFIYGTIVSVASGYVQFLWGNFGTRRTVPPGTTVDYRDYDKIEYRFEPAWWLEAIDTRLELAR
jgi:hypothetical protein